MTVHAPDTFSWGRTVVDRVARGNGAILFFRTWWTAASSAALELDFSSEPLALLCRTINAISHPQHHSRNFKMGSEE